MVTIKDIARDTGLSPATVARVLNDDARTRPETRARVRESADRLGYVANNAAQMMRGRSARLIGLIVPDILNNFYATMAKAMTEVCEDADHQLVLAVTEDDPEREERQMRAMVAARAAAVALVPSRAPTAATLELAKRQPFAQLVRHAPRLGPDWFGFGEADAIEAATAHLIALGHRRILLVCGGDRYSTGRARLEGYRRALAAAGAPLDPALVRAGRPNAEHGRAAILDGAEAAGAVIAAGVDLTLGVVEAIEERGLRVPDDMSVVGFGDAPWQRWWRSGMTRVTLPVRDIVLGCGTHLARMARKRAADDRSGDMRVAYAAGLVIGATSAPPRAALKGGAARSVRRQCGGS